MAINLKLQFSYTFFHLWLYLLWLYALIIKVKVRPMLHDALGDACLCFVTSGHMATVTG